MANQFVTMLALTAFALAAAAVFYVYVGYPVLLAAIAAFRKRPRPEPS